jgi:hypothetical protein
MDVIDDDETSSSERSPLLSPINEPAIETEPSIIPQPHSPLYIVLLITLVVFVFLFGAFLMVTPSLRVYEDIICHHFYDNIEGDGHVGLSGDIDEERCKGPEIQEELAIVMGGMMFADSIPGKGEPYMIRVSF